MKITNLTEGTHVSRKMVWDKTIPILKGNSVASYYSACESSHVPIHFNCGNYTYIVGKGYTYRTGLCSNKADIVQKMSAPNWRAIKNDEMDLKTILGLDPDTWDYLGSKNTFVLAGDKIQEFEVMYFDREVTWHFGIIPISEMLKEETVLLAEGKFIFTENNCYYRKNNDEYYQVWNFSVESFQDDLIYRVAQFKEDYCVFTCMDGICYGYEFSSDNGLSEAIEGISKKIEANLLAHTSLEEAVEFLIENAIELTIEDSYAVGNCKSGTADFIKRYFEDKKFLVINEENKIFILKLAQENNLFSNVLKNKYIANK